MNVSQMKNEFITYIFDGELNCYIFDRLTHLAFNDAHCVSIWVVKRIKEKCFKLFSNSAIYLL